MILFSSTDIIRIVIDILSPFRLLMFLLMFMMIIYVFVKGSLKLGRYLYFILLIAISSIISYYISTNKEWGLSFLLNDYIGIFIIFLISNIFDIDDLTRIYKMIILSQVVTILLNVYTLIQFYLKGIIVKEISLFNIFSIVLSDEYVRRALIFGQPRLALPYPSPPHLSVVMAICIFILLYKKDLFRKTARYFFIGVFSLILILTYSRTGIVASVLVYITILCYKNFKLKINLNKLILILSIIIFLLIFNQDNIYILDKFLKRFMLTNILKDRHLLVPIEGIMIWLSSIKRFVFGIGYGSSINMTGKYTFLPPHFLNSFVTLIAERGILGLLIVAELISMFRRNLKIVCNNFIEKKIYIISFLYMIIFFSFLFYEVRQNILVWIIIAVNLMVRDNIFKKMEFEPKLMSIKFDTEVLK